MQPGLLLGLGLFLSAGVGLLALLAGGEVLQSWIIDIHLPVIGDLHLVTSLFFDLGVYLVVVGLVLDILRSLGAEIDRRAETGEDPVGGDAVGGDAVGGDAEGDVPAQVGATAKPAGWDGSVP